MGALGETDVGATINPRAPLDIYSTIQTARHFYLWQEIHTLVKHIPADCCECANSWNVLVSISPE